MAPPSAVSRNPRHHNVDPDDVVLQRAMAMSDWARKNARVVIGVAVVVLVAAAGYLFYRSSQGERAGRAGSEYLQLQQEAETNPAAAKTRLSAFIESYAGTNEADEARLLLASLQLNDKQAKQAAAVLQPLADETGSPLAAQGAMLLGDAQAQAGDRNAAIAAYLTAADRAEMDYLKAEALDRAATLREQANDWKGAAELYRRMVDVTEKGSIERSQAEMRLAEAEGHARGR
jgi:predicted negative regulator of RcsB-dependent stress response